MNPESKNTNNKKYCPPLMDLYNMLIKREKYYYESSLVNAAIDCFDDVNFSKIRNFFTTNGKPHFFGSEEDEYFSQEAEGEKRCKHVFSTYLLGIHCYKKILSIQEAFKNLLTTNIYPNTKENTNDLHRDFLYLWYPTALYHDMGYCYEYPQHKYVKRNGYKAYADIVKDERMLNEKCFATFDNPYAAPEELKKTLVHYFKKRWDGHFFTERSCIDHGFAGGLKLCQKMWYIHNNPPHQDADKDSPFKYDPLFFKYYNTTSAWAILCHNMYLTKLDKKNMQRVKEYVDEGFEKLVYSSGKTFINLEQYPLLFLLDFVDTIEPTKRFGFGSLYNFEIVDSPENTLRIRIAGCNGGCCLFANTILKKISSDLDFLKSDTFRAEVDEGDNSITFSFGQASH